MHTVVPLALFLTFNRIKEFKATTADLVAAVLQSALLEVDRGRAHACAVGLLTDILAWCTITHGAVSGSCRRTRNAFAGGCRLMRRPTSTTTTAPSTR